VRCHCSRCRKNSGSAHGANVFVPKAQLAWERGESEAKRFDLPTARYWCTAFCRTCGTKMPCLSKSGKTFIVFIVPAGALDDDPGARPVRNVHFASRALWLNGGGAAAARQVCLRAGGPRSGGLRGSRTAHPSC
jgi:hypothetical protein